MIDSSKKIGIRIGVEALGNTVMWSHLPENYYRCHGTKLVDVERKWVFDFNPFVERGVEPEEVFDLSWVDHRDWMPPARNLPVSLSRADDRFTRLGMGKIVLRHPRLYRYEDLPVVRNKVIVHAYSDSNERPLPHYECRRRFLPEEVFAVIRERYADCDLVQVGGASDPALEGARDRRGLAIWDTVREMADAALFIGIDSGPSHLMACYPRVPRKIVLSQFDPEYLRTAFFPMNAAYQHHQWHDWGCQFYNCSEDDAGVTFSYRKI